MQHVLKFKDLDYPFFPRDAPPGPAATHATQELLRLVEAHPNGNIPSFNPGVTSMEYVEMRDECQQFEPTLQHYACTHCPQLTEHVSPKLMSHITMHVLLWLTHIKVKHTI